MRTPIESYDLMMTKIGYDPDPIDTPYIWSLRSEIEGPTQEEASRRGLELAIELYTVKFRQTPVIDKKAPVNDQIESFITRYLP